MPDGGDVSEVSIGSSTGLLRWTFCDFVELENSRQTFFVIGRVFSLKANYSAVKLVLDLPPSDGEDGFDPAS